MANQVYQSAGLPSSVTTTGNNKAYESAGLYPQTVAAPPATGAVMNQIQTDNVGSDLFNGTIQ